MVSTSLFRRVTRYTASPKANPAENRLTEITAGVLEHVPPLRYEIALKLARLAREQADMANSSTEAERRADILNRLEGLSPARVRVATQRATGGGKFVDLELLVRGSNWQKGGGVLMWVEVKHGADLHGTQLQDYLDDIKTAAAVGGDEPLVVLLAPRTAMPASKPPDKVGIAEWEDIAPFLAGQAADMPRTQRWILEQYTAYLEEEALIDPPALTAGHAFALSEQGAAHDAIRSVCLEAHDYVERYWAPRSSDHAREFGTGYWANHPKRIDNNWAGHWFEWGLRRTRDIEYLDDHAGWGTWLFVAGMTLASNKKQDPVTVSANADWVGRRRQEDFVHFWHGGYYRLCRLLGPEELLDQSTVQDQGRRLGDWIVRAFEALEGDPPDHRAVRDRLERTE